MKNNVKINAIILAGGIGARMHADKPKQFIEIDGFPIIVKTILNFEQNPYVDNVTIVCVREYISEMEKLVKKYKLSKVDNIVAGGETGHDSCRNGVYSLADKLSEKDFVIIHDAVRPVLPQKVINSMIGVALEKGNACLAVPCYETVVVSDDKKSGDKEIDRNSFMRVQTPQMYNYALIKKLYEKADKDNFHNSVYANTLAIHYGERIFFSPGFFYNFKITTPDDLPLYRVLMNFSEDDLTRK